MDILSVDTENHFNNYIRGVLIQNEVEGLMNVLTEERERFWMTLDMTKTGAAPGH